MPTLLTPASWITTWRPEYPYAADILSQGVYRMSRARALEKRHLELNTFGLANMVTFDVDLEEADWHIKALAYDLESIPEPNWWTINPESGHAHVGYILASPVAISPAGRQAPRAYLADIRRTLQLRLEGDPAYSGTFTRNPVRNPAQTHWGPAEGYTLRELHESLGTLERAPKADYAEDMDTSEGRHQALFKSVSSYCHRRWHHHWADTLEQGLGRASLIQDVLAFAHEKNREISPEDPLPAAEVESTVRSIVNWTWRTFNQQRFTKIQTARSHRRDSVRDRQERVQTIRDTAEAGHVMSALEVQETWQVSARTAYSYLEESGVNEAQRSLPEKVRHMKDVEGKTWPAIALELGITKDKARSQYRKSA